jgi:hypothetical protein
MSYERNLAGFSLVKAAIVFVVVGLIAGASLVMNNYQDMGEAQKDLTQLTKYKTAIAEFRTKFSYLPGDLPAALAMQLKFISRDGGAGRGDGNGFIEGNSYTASHAVGTIQSGEPLFLWEDLFSSTLIKDPFDTATDTVPANDIVGDQLDEYFPKAHFGENNRLYVYSDGKANFFGLSNIIRINGGFGSIASSPGLTIKQAYDIDKKMDDGLPTTGKVVARYINGEIQTAPPAATAKTALCYNPASSQYSVTSDAAALSCGLSFQFE